MNNRIEKKNFVYKDNGKIVYGSVIDVKKISPDIFCQMYIKDLDVLFKLTKTEFAVLTSCIIQSQWIGDDNDDDNEIGNRVISTLVKYHILEKTDISIPSIYSAFRTLTDKGLLIKDHTIRGIYYLNPKHLFKGKISERTKIITKTTVYVSTLPESAKDFKELDREIKKLELTLNKNDVCK